MTFAAGTSRRWREKTFEFFLDIADIVYLHSFEAFLKGLFSFFFLFEEGVFEVIGAKMKGGSAYKCMEKEETEKGIQNGINAF